MSVKGEPDRPSDAGRYRILGHVASGGMGEVFLAESVGAHGVSKKVAIKRILPRKDGRGESLFVEEARTAFALSHASIVQVFDFGVLEEDHVLVMEYVDGVDLARLLDALPGQRLPLDAALHVAIETLEGLAHAHGRTDDRGRPLHIVHCDIKPSNLLCSRDGEVKITDFGISRAAFQALDAVRAPGAGTVGYMAPEQAAGKAVDARADLYAVGAVLYRALTAQLPVPGTVPEIPADVAAPRGLGTILNRALATRAQDRYDSATEMLHDLEALAQREGILASPRPLATLVRQHLDRPAAPAKKKGLDDLVRARARALAGGAGTEPFSEGTNIVLAHVGPGVTEVRIVMPEPLMLPEPAAPSPAPARRGTPAPLALGAVLALLAGAVAAGAVLWPRGRAADAPVAERERARAAAPAPAAPAIVAVSTSPEGASVTIDDRAPVPAPAIVELPPGRHVLRAEAPAHRPASREIRVEPGARLAVSLALEATDDEDPPSGTAAPEPAAPTAVATPSPNAARKTATAGTGLLNISSVPWARISIDGRDTGQSTPARGIRLSAGSHVVELVNAVVGARRRFTVRIEAGQTAVHRVSLR